MDMDPDTNSQDHHNASSNCSVVLNILVPLTATPYNIMDFHHLGRTWVTLVDTYGFDRARVAGLQFSSKDDLQIQLHQLLTEEDRKSEEETSGARLKA